MTVMGWVTLLERDKSHLYGEGRRHIDIMHKISLASVAPHASVASDAFVIVNSKIMLNLIAMIERLRVLSSFSRLSQLKTTKNLLCTDEHSKDQRWVKISTKTLYKMTDNSENSYQRHVRKFCNHSHCSKTATIDKLIKKWDFNEKAMFCSMSPVQAKILYHVSSHVLCCAAFSATWRWKWQKYITLSMLISSV